MTEFDPQETMEEEDQLPQVFLWLLRKYMCVHINIDK